MLASYLLLAIPLKPLDFPESPLVREIAVGRQIHALGKGLDRLCLDDRQVVGVWFDGKARKEADHVIWLSPSLTSRWLGYLEAKEKWPAKELESRWRKLRSELGGRMTFIVRLCSMPRIDPLEGEIAAEADPSDAHHVRFLFTASDPLLPQPPHRDAVTGSSHPIAGQTARPEDAIRLVPVWRTLSDRQRRSAAEAMREDWWLRVPFGEALSPEFSERRGFEGYPLGEFYCSTYLATVPLTSDAMPASGFQLRVFSPNKERVAKFSIWERVGIRRSVPPSSRR